jgi:hypothetical protein
MSENQNLEAPSKFISIGDSFINIQSIAHAQVDGNEITIHLIGGAEFSYSDETAGNIINFLNSNSVFFF